MSACSGTFDPHTINISAASCGHTSNPMIISGGEKKNEAIFSYTAGTSEFVFWMILKT